MGAITCCSIGRITTPSGAGIILHRGKLYVNGRKVRLFITKEQRKKHGMDGAELHTALSGKFDFPSVEVMETLIANPRMIPMESWGKREIVFWDSFRVIGGRPYVRLLSLLNPEKPTSVMRCLAEWMLKEWHPSAILKKDGDED